MALIVAILIRHGLFSAMFTIINRGQVGLTECRPEGSPSVEKRVPKNAANSCPFFNGRVAVRLPECVGEGNAELPKG